VSVFAVTAAVSDLGILGLLTAVIYPVAVLIVPGRDAAVGIGPFTRRITFTLIGRIGTVIAPVTGFVSFVIVLVLTSVVYSIAVLILPRRDAFVWLRPGTGHITLGFRCTGVITIVVLTTVVYAVFILVVPGRDTVEGGRAFTRRIANGFVNATVVAITALGRLA
jgi:hypothetical protein